MKVTILFIDNTYPRAYHSESLQETALGGTEASVIRTANILASQYNVIVAQKFRTFITKESDTLQFVPKSEIANCMPNVIVVLRKYPLVSQLRKLYPDAQILLWLHTYKKREYILKRIGLVKSKVTIICNSLTHQQHTSHLINTGFLGFLFSIFSKKVKVGFCYNPIPRPVTIDTKKDVNKLIFLSSPNKGLEQVLKCFRKVSKTMPQLKLYIANPGYKTGKNTTQTNTVILGSLAHDDLMVHVKESLCVFYPQDTFAETFGLIYAEANSYGVPVLAHDIGSAKEILDDNNQLVNANDYGQITHTLESWQKKYPKIGYNEQFDNDSILLQWNKLLAG